MDELEDKDHPVKRIHLGKAQIWIFEYGEHAVSKPRLGIVSENRSGMTIEMTKKGNKWSPNDFHEKTCLKEWA